MIRLKNIHLDKPSGCIKAEAFVEDYETPVELSMNSAGQWEREPVLPEVYSYCDDHIFHAKTYLEKLVGKKFEPHDRLIMWY